MHDCVSHRAASFEWLHVNVKVNTQGQRLNVTVKLNIHHNFSNYDR